MAITYLCFKQKEATSILSGILLKLVDQFIYLSSNISSPESDVNMHWQVIDLMEVWSIWQNKMGFFPSCSYVHTSIWLHHMDVNKTY